MVVPFIMIESITLCAAWLMDTTSCVLVELNWAHPSHVKKGALQSLDGITMLSISHGSELLLT
jgi:hypothetical protein